MVSRQMKTRSSLSEQCLPSHSQKELNKFLGKVSCIQRFIPALVEISAPFGSLLKGDAKFEWNKEHQKAFERIKAALTSPQTMIAPQPGMPLMLYLTSTPKSIGALLVQDVDGAERPVYYISRKIRGAEVRYTPVERHCFALVFTAQKLRHYFLVHQIQIVTISDPIRYLLSKPALTGKVARWLLALGEFEITCVAPKAIKTQALADLLAQFPSGDYEPVNEELKGEVHATMASEESFWTLSFDGAAVGGKGGIGIVLTSKSGEKLYLSYKLDFHCSNNEAEYEALILGLIAAEKHSIKKIRIRGDSKLIVKQVSGQFILKEPALATYRTTVQRLLDKFQKVEIEHVPRSDNKFSDALVTLGARVDIPEEEATIIIKKRTEPSIIPKDKDLSEDWREEVLEQLRNKVGKLTMARLSQFIIIQGELYFRGGTGFLAGVLANKKQASDYNRSMKSPAGMGISVCTEESKDKAIIGPRWRRPRINYRENAPSVSHTSGRMRVALKLIPLTGDKSTLTISERGHYLRARGTLHTSRGEQGGTFLIRTSFIEEALRALP
ncbi:uncharacterized protein LOC114272919 [Camellia sinensis]|uniref:uncharacterized protein LOC114272919 n=1 Tax=Camellia sinensis TaxID=4442 RepID=UPI001036A6DF|nr:uncharacterized protein LOC114272919 [Camellia sinensis]